MSLLASALDLFLPAPCPGCGAPADPVGACPACLALLRSGPQPVRPTPAPSGLPPCVAAAEYAGEVRELLLAYKERGRRGLAGPLGDALAASVQEALPPVLPTVLVPVPTTASAARQRRGDHMRRLARRATRQLCAEGRPTVVAAPVRALPRLDSAHLDRHARALASRTAFVSRRRRLAPLRVAAATGAAIVLVDDVLTTGATLAALAGCLTREGVPVTAAVTVAATRLRWPAQS